MASLGLNELKYGKPLEQCLEYSEHDVLLAMTVMMMIFQMRKLRFMEGNYFF